MQCNFNALPIALSRLYGSFIISLNKYDFPIKYVFVSPNPLLSKTFLIAFGYSVRISRRSGVKCTSKSQRIEFYYRKLFESA